MPFGFTGTDVVTFSGVLMLPLEGDVPLAAIGKGSFRLVLVFVGLAGLVPEEDLALIPLDLPPTSLLKMTFSGVL